VRTEVLGVGVDEADELTGQDAQRAPHRVALAEHRTERGQQLGRVEHVGAEGGGDCAGAVARVAVDDEDLVDDPGVA
jgi:hypothetical protein